MLPVPRNTALRTAAQDQRTETSTILDRRNGRLVPCHVRRLNQDDLPRLYALMELIVATLEQRDWFVIRPRAHVLRCLRDGSSFGTFVDERLVAYITCFHPGPDLINLGIDMGLSTPELLRVGQLASSGVHPDFRGNRQNLKLKRRAIEQVFSDGYDLVTGTCSPFNLFSVRNNLRLGLRFRLIKDDYAGMMRMVYARSRLDEVADFDLDTTRWVDHGDIATQRMLLTKGYQGHAVRSSARTLEIAYSVAYSVAYSGLGPHRR